MQRQIQNQIFQHLNRDINDFQLALEKIASSSVCLPAIAKALIGSPSLMFQQKQKLAVGINFIVSLHFRSGDNNIGFWEQYYDCMATCPIEQLEWKIMKIMQPAVVLFMENFEQQFDIVMRQSYNRLNDYHVIMVTNCVIHHDIQADHQLHWLAMIYKDYIALGSRILTQVRSLNDQKSMKKLLDDYCLQYLSTLKEMVMFLKANERYGHEWSKILNDLSANPLIMQVIADFMNVGRQGSSHVEWFRISGQSMESQVQNRVKAIALQCYVAIIDQYDMQSSKQASSVFPAVDFMQRQIPLVVEQISRIPPEVLQLDCNEILCSSMISLISKGCEFQVMSQYFWDYGKFVFQRVVVPLLQLSNEEIRQYHNDPDDFVTSAISLVEDYRQRSSASSSCNLKLQTAYLLDSMCQNIDGMITYITHELVSFLQSDEYEQQKPELNITIENCFTILNLLAYWVFKREDLMQMISEVVKGGRYRLLRLQGIDKVRFLLFLKEYYEELKISRQEGQQYFLMAADCLTENECIMKSALEVFRDYKYVPEAAVVWNRLVELSPTTKSPDIFDLLASILAQRAQSMTTNNLLDIVDIIIMRIKQEFDGDISKAHCYSDSKTEIFLPNRDCVLSCLRIIREIAIKADGREDSQELFGAIWPLFDMMEGFGVIEYSDEIIKVFNIVVGAKEEIGEEFFQFLNSFEAYNLSEKQVGELYQTYTLLFQRGKYYLKSTKGQAAFKTMISNLLCVVNFRINQTVCEALTLLQFAILLYPQQIIHSSIFESTKTSLDNFKQPYKKHILAQFLNLWWIGSAYSPEYRIESLLDSSTNIFEGYNGRVLAVALKMNIAEQCYAKDISLLLKTLKYAVRFLDHYLKFPTEKKQFQKRELAHFANQNPELQIKQCFRLCKQMLSTQNYDEMLREVANQAPLEAIKQLLSYRVVRSEPRKILRISQAR